VYVPLLISQGQGAIPLFAFVFGLLKAAWCGLGFGLVSHPTAGRFIDRYGPGVVPFVLIGIGAYILAH
jgi:cadmium resistance protein CadD (predicted permease)